MKFLRRTWSRYSKLGRKRKSKQVWRRPTGRDNKMREKRKGYPALVSIGYRGKKEERDSINGKSPVIVNNVKDLENIKKNEIGILGKVGKKKKLEILRIAEEKKIPMKDNIKKAIKKLGKKNESKK